ncbi:MAG: hypothetical protein OJJ54_08930 [Pseudonocardia sp.]|nr:hypothetical protein [Pseudonocardia sp.]
MSTGSGTAALAPPDPCGFLPEVAVFTLTSTDVAEGVPLKSAQVSGIFGAGGADLPEGAITLPNDAGLVRYLGAAPPEGHGVHRYHFVVHAVDLPTLGIPKGVTPAFLGFTLFGHTLARARITAVYER